MKKFIFSLILLTFVGGIYSQDLYIPNNPYDKADEITKSRNAFKRERWFYEQRMYPFNFIPTDAYEKAYRQREQLRQKNGFYFDNSVYWFNIGPTPGTYPGYGNISSRITSIKIDPINPNIIYLGGAFGGVWKSTDGGFNWVSKTHDEVSLSTGSIAIDPTNTNIIYYGTGEATYSGASYYGRGLLKSTNGGDTWTNYTTGLPSLTYFSRIVIRPNHNNELLAALGNNGLYRSTNYGVSWTQLVSTRTDDVVFSPTGDTAYSIGSGGFRISLDGGATFSLYNVGIGSFGTRSHVAICKAQPNVLYISIYASSAITVWKSTDAGFNFSQIAAGTDFNGSQAWYDFYMHVNPFDPNIAYVGSIDIWRTTNGGQSFQNITNGYSGGYVHVDQHNMDFHPTDPNKLYAVNDGGVWVSTDKGNSFTNLNSTLTLTQFYRIAAEPNNAAHILGGTQDNGTQQTFGTINWSAAFGGDGGDVCFQSQNNQYILGETQNNGVRRSTNGGLSFVSATNGLSGTGAWVGPLLSHPDSAGIFYTARQVVFKTTNYAANWFSISTGTSGTIREMAISKSDPKVMYATSGSTIYRSTDRGYTFTNVTSGTPNRTITSINIHPDSSNVAIVTFSGFGAGKIYKTTNTGNSWFNVSGDLPDSPTNDGMFYYPGFATSIMLVGMDIGVFMSSNYGTNWIELAQGLPNTVAIHLDYNQLSGKLRIGTHGRGVYELSGALNILSNKSGIPENYSLSQNYPNPFNPNTKIQFSIPKSEYVTLSVYDILGREIKNLVNKKLDAGNYEINFTAENLNSGVYFYKIVAGNYTESKKMLLVK
ncbi:MAG: T9SS type A sorting domain-containing protein [Ignavibacteria bacterium]|nr:T9SS type A sorting domain-containing protein [Ignavibacteria bacterium]